MKTTEWVVKENNDDGLTKERLATIFETKSVGGTKEKEALTAGERKRKVMDSEHGGKWPESHNKKRIKQLPSERVMSNKEKEKNWKHR